MDDSVKHPAKFSRPIVDKLWELIAQEVGRHYGWPIPEPFEHRPLTILDPFAGVGGVHSFGSLWTQTFGVEIELEWARVRPGTMVSDATRLPFTDDSFDMIVTSPCYGNRMADTYDGKGVCRKCLGDGVMSPTLETCDRCNGTGHDSSRRHTYRLDLGRMPTRGSAAVMQWGDDYRLLHIRGWRESIRVLRPGGLMLVNISDHVRGKRVIQVSDWHRRVLEILKLNVERELQVKTRRLRDGQNHEARVDYEKIIVGRKAAGPAHTAVQHR